MPGLVIKNYLSLDVNDTTPQAVIAANPTLFTSASDVPLHLYTSLKTIWVGTTASNQDFANRIVPGLGFNAEMTEGFITICPLQMEDTESPDSMMIDQSESEYALVRILLGIARPVSPVDFYKVRDADLRIRLLLDQCLRGKAGKPPDLPIAGDNTIDSTQFGIFRCFRKRFDTFPNASELSSVFRVEYFRTYGQVIVNIP
jgi:hypothetical protein